jgi:hypothetical protein
MGEWVVRVVAVQTDRACELTVTVVTVGVRRVRAAAAVPTEPQLDVYRTLATRVVV